MSALTALEIRELTNFLKPFLEREYLDRVYPIGSLYFSATEVDPSALFGGTWERIKDRFLLASGGSYAVGSEGGSADAIVVSHTHDFKGTGGDWDNYDEGAIFRYNSSVEYANPAFSYGSYGSSSGYISIKPTGESGAGKNMPPYLAICVWKRTA